MKLGVTLDILNQKDTPAFYADTLANRPAAGFTGRVFISTDTLDLYRDTGTTWVLLSPSSTGTITGSGAAGQVTYFSATSSITGNNNLFWDSANNHLGIQTATPDCALDVNHNGTFVAKFNNTTSANTLIGIFNLDNPQWLIGSNSVANDLTFYDATNSPTLVATTTMKTDGTTFIGGQTTGSGRLNVYSATGDNGIQISGANAPSLRIDNAPTGATKRIGLGISTATNNFIQGSADRDMCIFNGSTTASPILFGIYNAVAGNVQEAARISATRNFLIGTTTDNSKKLQVSGDMSASAYYVPSSAIGGGFIFDLSGNCGIGIGQSSNIIQFYSGGSERMRLDNSGNVGIGTTTPNYVTANRTVLDVNGINTSLIALSVSGTPKSYFYFDGNDTQLFSTTNLALYSNSTERLRIVQSTGNVLIGTTTDNGNKLQVSGTSSITGIATFGNVVQVAGGAGVPTSGAGLELAGTTSVGNITSFNRTLGTYLPMVNNSLSHTFFRSGTQAFEIKSSGVINISNIPTSATGLVSGDIYSNAGILTIVP